MNLPCGFLGLERIGPGEALIVLLIVLVLFGARRLPDLARSLGRSLGEFRKGREEGARVNELNPDQDADAAPKKPGNKPT